VSIPALELLYNSFCDPGTKTFGDSWPKQSLHTTYWLENALFRFSAM